MNFFVVLAGTQKKNYSLKNKMIRFVTFLLLCITIVVPTPVVYGWPRGAPICESGSANVRSLHLDKGRDPRTGDIQTNGFDVFLNGTLIQPGSELNPTRFKAHTDLNVTVKSRTGETFRGVLLLLHQFGVNVHLGEGLLPLGPFKKAFGCGGTNISGVTHSENSMKTEVTSNLHYDNTGGVCTLDVNIVVANNEIDGSAYFFSEYYLLATEDDHDDDDEPCGLFGWGLFCPRSFCGFFGRLLGLCREEHDDDGDSHDE